MTPPTILPARRRRGLFWLAVLVAITAVTAIAVGSLVAYEGYAETSGPEGAVRGYFAALQRADAAAALGFGDIPSGPHTLLTATVLKEQRAIAPIRNLTLGAVQRQGDQATVQVDWTLDFGATHIAAHDSIDVRKHGYSWRLSAVAARTRLQLGQAKSRAAIVGAAIPSDDVLVFPGAAPVRMDTPYLQVDPGSSVITLSSGGLTSLAIVATPGGRTQAKSAVVAALQSCLRAGADPRCPLPDHRAIPGSARGTLSADAAGQLSVLVADDPAGLLQVNGTIDATGQFTVLDFDNTASQHRGAMTIPVRATAYAVGPLVVNWVDGAV
ncbi:MAG: hypothetical protein JWP39_3947 [Jatrophihabitans sp.]|nr:hypothetical protein [Jatrophihabitans sp.]